MSVRYHPHGVGGTVFKSVVNDSLYDSLTFQPVHWKSFEVAIQPRDTFENLQLIEDAMGSGVQR